MAIYIVRPRADQNAKPRLVKAPRINEVESHLLSEFEITKASAEQAAEIVGDGVKVEPVATE